MEACVLSSSQTELGRCMCLLLGRGGGECWHLELRNLNLPLAIVSVLSDSNHKNQHLGTVYVLLHTSHSEPSAKVKRM